MKPFNPLRRSTQVSQGGCHVQLRLAVPFLIAMVLTLTPLTSLSVAAAPVTPTLQIKAPTQVNPGDPIVITLAIQNSNDVAAFESSVLFDTTAAEFGNWQVANNSVHSIGRDVSELAAPETPYGAAIGFYSCPVSNCTDNRSPRHAHGAAGTVQLGTLTLIGDKAGTLAVTFDAVKAVDSSGNTITLSLPTTTINVQIGAVTSSPQATTSSTGEAQTASAGGRFPFFPSPPGRWKLKNAGKGKAGPFSTTGTGDVSNADATLVAMAWENLRARGNPCGPGVDPTLDVNHDGCIDVSDLEGVAANYGPTNTSRIETPASDVATHAATTQAATADATTQDLSSTFVVNSTGDQDDANKGDGICMTSVGTCTFRAAIAEANNDPGPNTINFNIPGSGVQTIQLATPMHTIFDTTGPTTINGYTQPGSSPNTDPLADNARIMVQIEGGGYDQYDALAISSSGNVIEGLALYSFHRTIWIYGKGANNNVIVGDFVGTDSTGTAHATATGDAEAHGIKIEMGASQTTIGRPNLADRNVISGNARSGIGIWHNGSNGEVIQNNILGLSPDGTRRLSNQLHGVDMNYGTQNDLIGGNGLYEHNVSSGNNYNGIDVSHTASTELNKVIGNYVGTNLAGTASPSYTYNLRYGIRVKDGVTFNTIANNVIGGMNNHVSDGNGNVGIVVLDSPTSHNTFTGNLVGVSLNGTAMPNSVGIAVYGTSNTFGPGNVIADNAGPGIEIETGATGNTITQNSIYGNTGLGIQLDSGANNGIAAPTISSASVTAVSGTACASCTIEAFVADGGTGAAGEGKTLVGTGSADGGGAFTVTLGGVNSGDEITTTATDSSGDTSQFAANVPAGGTPPPGITIPGHFEFEDYQPGGEGVGYHDTTPGNTGGQYRNDDVDIQTCTDPTTPSGQTCYNIGWTAAGEWLAYNVNVTSAGSYTFAIRVATVNSGKTLHFELDGTNISGTIAVPNTGGWQTWQTVTTNPITLPAGIHTLKLVEDTGGYNLNYVDVATAVVSKPTAPTGLNANAVSSSEIDLSWTDTATNATAYTVQRSPDQTNWAVVTSTLPADATSYNDTGLNASTTYYYEVLATNSGGSSDPSNIQPATTLAATDTISLPGRVEAENYRLGGEGVGYHDTTPGNTGNADRHDDVDIQTCSDSATITGMPCYNVGWIAAGEWLAYDVNVAADGNYTFTTRVASTTSTSSFHIEVDGTNITGAIPVPNTGGNQTWVSIGTSSIPLTAGTHTLKLVFDTGGFNVDYVDVAPAESTQAVTLPGHIEFENYISGGEGAGYHDTTASNLGGAYHTDGVDIQTCADPSTPSGQTCFNIGWTVAGEWLAYNVNLTNAGNYTFAIRLTSPNSGGKFHLELDGTNISGSIAVPNTGSWQAWTTVTTGPIALPAGAHTLKIVEDTGGYNLNYMDIAAAP